MGDTVDDRLIAKLQELHDRTEQINAQLADPDVASNPNKSIALAKELGKLRRLVDPYRELRRVKEQLDEANEVADDAEQDEELRELAGEEIPELESEYARRLEGLKESIVTSDDAAIGSIILEIRAGTGGDEAALFVRDLSAL